MKLRNLGANLTEVDIGDTTVLFSYRTPVACRSECQGYYRTSVRYSRTTTRHVNKWLDGAIAREMPQEYFDGLVDGRRCGL